MYIVQCPEHGPSPAMFVCRHIEARSVKPGDVTTVDDSAYCAACEARGVEQMTADDVAMWCVETFRAFMEGE